MDDPGEYKHHYAALQQHMWVLGVVSEITDIVFTRCIQGKPEETLSGVTLLVFMRQSENYWI